MSRVLPILFNTDMVRAILDGRKTLTRRLVKSQQLIGILPDKCKNGMPEEFLKEKKFMFKPYCDMTDVELIKTAYNPPYQPGDILYVRECGIIQSMKNFGKTVKMYFPADDTLIEFKVTPDEYERLSRFPEDKKLSPYWLTKQESRIWLKVTDVRVERLQDITEEQALSEGVPDDSDYPISKVYCPRCHGEGLIGAVGVSLGYMEVDCPDCDTAIKRFKNLWNSTIKKSDLDLYGWDANPWVWVIEFERCEKPDTV